MLRNIGEAVETAQAGESDQQAAAMADEGRRRKSVYRCPPCACVLSSPCGGGRWQVSREAEQQHKGSVVQGIA